jgi:hypothetical protein
MKHAIQLFQLVALAHLLIPKYAAPWNYWNIILINVVFVFVIACQAEVSHPIPNKQDVCWTVFIAVSRHA